MPAIEVVDHARLAERLAECVREAAALALSMFQTPIKTWTKAGASPVSDADIAVDRLLRERLTGEGEGFAWLSEESADDPARLTARNVWIVDPIDGDIGVAHRRSSRLSPGLDRDLEHRKRERGGFAHAFCQASGDAFVIYDLNGLQRSNPRRVWSARWCRSER